MSIRQAAGNGQPGFAEDLGGLATEPFSSVQRSVQSWKDELEYDWELPKLPPAEPIWYTYWYGNALKKCYPDGRDPLLEGGFVGS
jgi:hypothetical protein